VDKATRFFKTTDTVQKWHLVDAEGKTLGRIATEIARLLRGKHKPEFTPNADLGDFVVVVNAAKVKVTGKRSELKEISGRSAQAARAGVRTRGEGDVAAQPARTADHQENESVSRRGTSARRAAAASIRDSLNHRIRSAP
jgi:large subunit ribosomal protein L13